MAVTQRVKVLTGIPARSSRSATVSKNHRGRREADRRMSLAYI